MSPFWSSAKRHGSSLGSFLASSDAFLGWLRGERDHCKMAAIPTFAEEGAKRPLLRLQISLEDRRRNEHRRRLGHPISDRESSVHPRPLPRHWLWRAGMHGPARPSGTPCRTAHRSDRRAFPSLWRAKPSEASAHFPELVGSHQSPVPCLVLNSP